MRCLRATDPAYRFVVLVFNCLLTFGSYFFSDMPSVLQAQFQGNLTCIKDSPAIIGNSTALCGPNCLGMNAEDYNLLYAISAWTNGLVLLSAGFLVDKLGNRFGVLLFTMLCLLGSVMFAVGALLRGTNYMLPVMLFGRLLFGAGNGSLLIAQGRIAVFWFINKELAFAFGCAVFVSRLGNVLNFLLTENFANAYGLYWTLWGGACLCGLSVVAGIIVTALDKLGARQLGMEDERRMESKRLKFEVITTFPAQYWLLAATMVFFFNGVFPFIADASKFLQDKYNYGEANASYVAGIVYDVSLFLSPFLGLLIDVVGKRGLITLGCAILTLPVFGLLAYSMIYPFIPIIWLALMYCLAAASMWPSVPIVVPQVAVGTAMGITTSLQMLGMGICHLIVGAILGTSDTSHSETLTRWRHVMLFLFLNTVACVFFATLLTALDRRRGKVLNMSRSERNAMLEEARLEAWRAQIYGEEDLEEEEEEEEGSDDGVEIIFGESTENEHEPLLAHHRARQR